MDQQSSKMNIEKEANENLKYACNNEQNHEGMKFKCTFCDKLFKNKVNFKMHVNRVHKYLPKESKCEICEVPLFSSQLEQHKKQKHSQDTFNCEIPMYLVVVLH